MITIRVLRNKNGISSIVIRGHSGYDELGKDIVCSSVSTAAFISCGLLEKLNLNFSFQASESAPNMEIEIKEQNDLTNAIMDNFVENMAEVSKDYPRYLQIKEENRR